MMDMFSTIGWPGFLLSGFILGVVAGAVWFRQRVASALHTARHERELLQQRLTLQEADLKQSRAELTELRQLQAELSGDKRALQTELEQQQKGSEEKLRILNAAKEQLALEFERLANRIFDAKQEKFSSSSKQTLETTLSPLREQLKEFRTRVEDVYDKETRDRSSLRQELKHLQELNRRISDEALNLTRALKGKSKTRGNWGEVVLERVLEESGLRKGHEYETQASFTDDSGRRLQPDVIVRLPENKDIVIDSKVSLLDYERYCNSEDETERQQALQQHTLAVKKHIDSLSFKAYESIEGIRSLDFVFIFIPIEAAFMAAFEHDPEVFRDAYEKNIIVVSPTTLLATLRTVQSIWRYERQNRNSEQIAREAGALHDQFVRVVESLEEVGKNLDRGRQSWEKAMDRLTRGRGNMASRVNRLEKLGAKVKKALPGAVVDRLDSDWESPADVDADADADGDPGNDRANNDK